jgi:hypothetical protein
LLLKVKNLGAEMEFKKENYSTIKVACENKKEIEFVVEISATAFSKSEAPSKWTAYPPACLPPEGYAQVLINSGSDKRGTLTKLELLVHLDGGQIFYKKVGNNEVSLKITWAEND